MLEKVKTYRFKLFKEAMDLVLYKGCKTNQAFRRSIELDFLVENSDDVDFDEKANCIVGALPDIVLEDNDDTTTTTCSDPDFDISLTQVEITTPNPCTGFSISISA